MNTNEMLEIVGMDKLSEDYVYLPDVEFRADENNLYIGDHWLNEAVTHRIAQMLKAPPSFCVSTSPRLASLILNHQKFLSTAGMIRLIKSSDGNVVAVSSGKSMPLLDEFMRVPRIIEKNLGSGTEYLNATPAKTGRVVITAVADQIEEPLEGDFFRAGIVFDYDLFDRKGLTINGFNHRLVCENGMYAVENVSVSRKSLPDSPYLWLRENIAEVWSSASSQFERLVQAQATKLPTGAAFSVMLDHLMSEFRIPREARKAVMNRILNYGAETLYDVINHVTYVATHQAGILNDPDRAYDMMLAAGRMTEHSELCDSCKRVL